MVVHDLALNARINVADAIIKKYSSRYYTYLTKRFDRIRDKRIHFASAMTLLGYNDGSDFAQGVSYLELAEFIAANGAKVNEDLEELWKRIVFNICVPNTIEYFRLSEKKALKIISLIKKAVSNWSAVAKQYKIPKTEQDMMQTAFITT